MHWLSGGYSRRVVGMGKLSVYNRCKHRRADDPFNTSGLYLINDDNWPPLEQEVSPIVDVEDLSMVLLQLDNGVQCSYMECHYVPAGMRNYLFIGTHGRIENMSGHTIDVYTQRTRARDTGPEITYHVRQLAPTGTGHGGADPIIVRSFLEFARHGTKTNTSPVAARNAVAAGYMATISIRNGCAPQDVPMPPEDVVKYFEDGQCR
jgi:hypothetical protein